VRKNGPFHFKLVQGVVSGANLFILFRILSSEYFTFLSSQGTVMMALGIMDLGLGVKFVNKNISAKRIKPTNPEHGSAQIYGLHQYIKLSLLISSVLTFLSVPMSQYFLRRSQIGLNSQNIALIGLTTFIFLTANFASKVYLSMDRLVRVVKIQALSSIIQFALTFTIYALKLDPICYVYILCIPGVIMIIDLQSILKKHYIELKSPRGMRDKIHVSLLMQVVQICQTVQILIISILLVKYQTDVEAAYSSLMLRIVTTLLAATGMHFIQSWIESSAKILFFKRITFTMPLIKSASTGKRNATLIFMALLLSCLIHLFLQFLSISYLIELASFLWGLVVVTQLIFWSSYYTFLGKEKYLLLFLSSAVGVLSVIPTTLVGKNLGVIFPPLLCMNAQVASYVILYLNRAKSQL